MQEITDSNQVLIGLSVPNHFYRFLDGYPHTIDGKVLIPVIRVLKRAKMIVDDWEIDHTVRVLRNNLFMYTTDEFDSA